MPVRYKENYYDIVIAGSDQVWNYMLTGGDKGYFLDFVGEDTKKISYAPSFGMSVIESEWENMYTELLNRFQYLSVREQDGREIFQTLLGKKVSVVLDPTFLIKSSEWIQIFDLQKRKEDYIFCYLFGMSEKTKKFIEYLSIKEDLKIISISDNISLKRETIKYDCVASPLEWLEYIFNAKYVITNSFHGTAFSIIFNKEFYVGEILNEKGRNRIDNLLKLVNLSDRTEHIEMEKIDYSLIMPMMEPYIQSSLNFLEKAMEGKFETKR